jgi:hypothetical protein
VFHDRFPHPPDPRPYDDTVRSADTAPEAYAKQIEAYRSMSPERRVVLAAQMSDDMLAVAADGIRARHPEYDEARVRWALLRLRHGDDTFRAAWPDAPLLAP